MRAIYWRRSVWWPTLTPLAIVGGAAIVGACSGLPTLRPTHRSEAVVNKATPLRRSGRSGLAGVSHRGQHRGSVVGGHGQRCGRRAGRDEVVATADYTTGKALLYLCSAVDDPLGAKVMGPG